jgi:coproporphyrinogen III oxidase-like Fe-S oxidoreductase
MLLITPDIVGSVVQGYVTKIGLQSIIENLTLYDLYPSSKTVAGSIGIQPNKYITSEETKDVTLLSQNQLMQNGLREIIAKSDGVKSAECRYNNNR